MSLPSFGVRRPVTVTMVVLGLLAMAGVAFSKLAIDLMPEMEMPAVSVIVAWPGASTENVEEKVTKVIENGVATVPDLDKILSSSSEGRSVVTCLFNWETDLDEAANDIRDRLEFAKRLLPEDIDTPIIFKFNTSMMPVIFYAVTADESWERLQEIVSDEIADRLKRIAGVGGVMVMAPLRRRVNVNLDLARLQARGLSFREVAAAIAMANVSLPAGELKMGRMEYSLRIAEEYASAEEIAGVVIREVDGARILVRDVAEVEDGFADETLYTNCDGRRTTMLMVQKKSGANVVSVCRAVRKKIVEISPKLPRDVRLIPVMDTAEFIEDAIRDLGTTVLWGGVLVCLATLFFLRRLSATFVIIVTIPLSLFSSFILLDLLGYTINMMSLMSLAIAVGMVVDNAVVVVDNILRHRAAGKDPYRAAIDGSTEVSGAVTAAALTTIVIFVPMIFMGGLTGVMFRQLALVIVFALIVSLIAALTFAPMLASRLFRREEPAPSAVAGTLAAGTEGGAPPARRRSRLYRVSETAFAFLERTYASLLLWALSARMIVVGSAITAFIVAVLLIPLVGTEFAPEQDTGDIQVTFELPVGTRVERTTAVAQRAAAMFRRTFAKETKLVFFKAGYSREGFGATMGQREGSHVALGAVKLTKRRERSRDVKEIGREFVRMIKEELNEPDLAKVELVTMNPLDRMMLGGVKPISIEIIGHDLAVTDRLAQKIAGMVRSVEGAKDVTIDREYGKPEFKIAIDEARAAGLWLTRRAIADNTSDYIRGATVSMYREGDKLYDIVLRLRPEDRRSEADLRDMTFAVPGRGLVRLDSVAAPVRGVGPVEIKRKDKERVVSVGAGVYERPLGDVSADVRKKVESLRDIPPDVDVTIRGMVEEMEKAFADFHWLFLLGVFLVYAVMASQFESLLHPLVIMFSVPFAFVGVTFGLLATGYTLSLVSFIGLIMLIGIVVNNAILLVDYTNILRARGLGVTDAIRQAGANRLRPILITTATTVFGMMPLALNRGEGSEIWRPIGISVISGLLCAAVVTLLLVPVVYSLLEDAKRWWWRKHGSPAPEASEGNRS